MVTLAVVEAIGTEEAGALVVPFGSRPTLCWEMGLSKQMVVLAAVQGFKEEAVEAEEVGLRFMPIY